MFDGHVLSTMRRTHSDPPLFPCDYIDYSTDLHNITFMADIYGCASPV